MGRYVLGDVNFLDIDYEVVHFATNLDSHKK